MLASAAARGVSSQTSAPPQPTLSQQTLSVQQPDLHPTSTLDSGSVPESIETFHDADSADLRVTRQEFEALWQRAVARGDIRDSQWTQDLKTMALLWAPESL